MKKELWMPQTPAQKLCRECKQPISKDAKVCYHCNRNQHLFWLCVEKVGVLGSLILVFLAFLQFIEARHERIKAESARDIAQQARQQAQALADEVRMIAQANAQLATLTITPAQGNSLAHQKRLLHVRDELLGILRQIGCDAAFISETEKNINEAIEYNLVTGLHRYVSSHYTAKWNDYQTVIYAYPRDFDALRKLFGAMLNEDTQLSEHIDALEQFSKGKKILNKPEQAYGDR
jgi:hypothetical protein